MCAWNSLSLISRDSRTPRNSGTNFNLAGENVTGYRYMIHLYCLAVQAGFYSDAVECRTLSPADRVRSPVREKCYFHFFTCYNCFPNTDFTLISLFSGVWSGSTQFANVHFYGTPWVNGLLFHINVPHLPTVFYRWLNKSEKTLCYLNS